MKLTSLLLICVWGCATVTLAQQRGPDVPVGTTTVSGRVFCADTNAPARLARVLLQPAELVDEYSEHRQNGVVTQGEAVQTQMDGSFVIPHVAPGAYYVIASLPGYLSPLAPLLRGPRQLPELAGPEAKKIAALVPRLTVQANLPASVNVSLERGAAVSGTILYDDGSPAGGVAVQLLVRREKQWVPLPPNPFRAPNHDNITDDHGTFRISGLPAQEYVLEAEMRLTRWEHSSDGKGSTGSSFGGHIYSFSTYSGGKTRLKEAKPFSIKAGEERRGEDIEIPVSKLHTVRGSIMASRDGHVVNGAFVSLVYPDDKSQASWAWVSNSDDSFFQLNFVPEGDYILAVNQAADNGYVESRDPNNSWLTQITPHALRSYGPAQLPLHVEGDMFGVTITVPDLQEQPAQPMN